VHNKNASPSAKAVGKVGFELRLFIFLGCVSRHGQLLLYDETIGVKVSETGLRSKAEKTV
jgi:hypothetical protein